MQQVMIHGQPITANGRDITSPIHVRPGAAPHLSDVKDLVRAVVIQVMVMTVVAAIGAVRR